VRQITVSRAKKSEGISIGDLGRLTGMNIETIRYYEKIKMLQAPPRTAGGHRVYGPNETRALAFIRRARELGFTLDEIRALLDLGAPERHHAATCGGSPRIISSTSRRKLAISKSWNVYWLKQLRNVQATRYPIALCWISWMFNVPDCPENGHERS
jgi:DNA-binding transcriptional MerR regulator